MRRETLVLTALLALFGSGLAAQQGQYVLGQDERAALGEPLGKPLSGDALAARAKEVGSLLRCPVCQGLSVFDSPVAAAQSMQKKVELLLAAGYGEAQILTYFETSYGEFIRLEPKAEGFNLVVWLLPVAAIVLGIALIVWRVRRAATPAEVDAEQLAAYRRRVREEMGE